MVSGTLHWMLWWKLISLLERKRATSTAHRWVNRAGYGFLWPEESLLFQPANTSFLFSARSWKKKLICRFRCLDYRLKIFHKTNQGHAIKHLLTDWKGRMDISFILSHSASFWKLLLVGIQIHELSCYFSQLSDKDLAYLEERIKRSSKNRPTTAPPSENVAKSSVSVRGGSDSSANGAKKKEDKKPGRAQVARYLNWSSKIYLNNYLLSVEIPDFFWARSVR